VCGGVFCTLAAISIPTLVTTFKYSKQAKIEAKAHLESKRWAAFQIDSSELQASGISAHSGSGIDMGNSEISVGDDGDDNPWDHQKKTAPKAMKMRDLADDDNSEYVPAFDEVFTPRLGEEDESGKRMNLDVNFMKLRPSKIDASTWGCHKVSMLPSHHARSHAIASVIITAYHSSGRNETVYQTKASKPLGSIMRAWCKQHRLAEEKAKFMYHGKPVRTGDTIGSLGHDLSKGPITIRARPAQSSSKAAPANPEPAAVGAPAAAAGPPPPAPVPVGNGSHNAV